jgi:TolB-like protein
MEFRIGINLGDVIEEEERIYGDGVNIAARVEGLASAGGISISGTVYEHIKDKLSLGYHYLGEQDVKNIPEPVRVYRLLTQPGDAGKMIGVEKPKSSKRLWATSGSIATIILVVGVFAVWNIYFHLPSIEIVSTGKIEINLPKGHSIAVLPFVNMSGDSNQDYFSDGLTENIITGLSACQKLLVIARNSTFAYKGKPSKVQQIAQELGVQYIVEGSVQKSGNRVRIAAQLIDGATGHLIWAEKYDRELKDIFALQDEIALQIMASLEVKLTEGEQAQMRIKGQGNLEAFMKILKALSYIRHHNIENNNMARQELNQAISLSPDYAGAYAGLAMTYILDVWLGTEYPILAIALSSKFVKKAISLDPQNSDAYLVLSILNMVKRNYMQAVAAAEKAVNLNPNISFFWSE